VDETCLATDLAEAEARDFDTPAPGQGFWYLVQGANGCGAGGVGTGQERLPVLCLGCPHDKCETGEPLGPTCEFCVERICDVRPSCCSGAWDEACVAEVLSTCGLAICPDSQGSCPHFLCTTGVVLQPGCDSPPAETSCVQTICETDSFCCNSLVTWDLLCVAHVEALCELSCEGAELENPPTNDTCENVRNLVQPGDTVRAAISPACDFDHYKLTLAQATWVSIELTGADDTALQLFDCGSGAVQACDDDSGEGAMSRIEGCLPAGEHWIKVRAFDGGSSFNYGFHVRGGGGCLPDDPPTLSSDGCPNGDLAVDFDSCP
jgi:hypothetical protein